MDKASQLDAIFFPRNLAVIGVSANEDTFGGRFLKALIDFGFKGKLFPVNPKGGEVFGLKIYPTVSRHTGARRLGRHHGAGAASCRRCCASAWPPASKGAQIYSSGFAETGEPERAALEEELKAIAAQGIRVIGPNCFGVYCPAGGHTLLPGGDFPKESGPVGFISQSGGHAVELGRQAQGPRAALQQGGQLRQRLRRQRGRPAGVHGAATRRRRSSRCTWRARARAGASSSW